MTLTPGQLLADAEQAGFKGVNAAIIAAIAEAESGGNTSASHANPGGSIDRGVLQINNVYHNEVSDTCAYDPTGLCAFQQAFKISGGSNFSQWSTYQSGAYANYVNEITSGVPSNLLSNIGAQLSSLTGNTPSSSTQLYGGADWKGGVIRYGLVIGGAVIVIAGLFELTKKRPSVFGGGR